MKYTISEEKVRIMERIKQIRGRLGLNRSEFARKLDVPRSAVSEFENGIRSPSKDFILSLHKIGVSIDWFVSGVGEMFEDNKLTSQPFAGKPPSVNKLTSQPAIEIPSLGAQIDQRFEKLEAQIAEIKSQLKKKGMDALDSGMFVSEPEPEYGETEEGITFVEGIAAGKPIYQSDVRSTIRVPKRYIKTKPEDYYAGRIKGTSMTAAGIPDGVLVLIRISDTPRDGAIQVVEHQGEATLKRMREVPGKGWKICFDDHTGRHIEIGPGDEFHIQGDFVAVLPEPE